MKLLPVVASLVAVSSLASSALARPTPEDLAGALAGAIWGSAAPIGAFDLLTADLQSEYRRLDVAVTRGEPDYTDELMSAALLARQAQHPATRAAMYDLARQLLYHSIESPDISGAVAMWNQADPFLKDLQLGVGLAQSDIVAAIWLEGIGDGPDGDTTARLLEVWEENAWSAPNQHFLTRLNAWGAGTKAGWPGMDATARAEASGVTFRDAVPVTATVVAVTGSEDLFGWLSAVTLILTPQERDAHPALMAMLADGSLAGGMARMPAGTSPGAWADSSSFLMMFRLNNYMIGGGDIADWQAGAAMWGLE